MKLKTIIKNFKHLTGKYLLFQLLIAPAGLLLSFIIMSIILIFEDSNTTQYGIISPLFCLMFYFLLGLIYGVKLFLIDFTKTVKVCSTRKNYLAGIFLYFTLSSLTYFLFMLMVRFEVFLAKVIFNEDALRKPPIIDLTVSKFPLFAGGCLLMFIVCILIGAIVQKFGAMGLVIVYFLSFILPSVITLNISSIKEFLSANPIAVAFSNINVAAQLFCGIALAAAAMVFSLRVYMKTDIK